MAERLIVFGGKGPLEALTADVAVSRGVLSVSWRADGDVADLIVPEPAGRERRDGLWRTTCFEVFVRLADGGYLEVNLSPSGEWAAYVFDGYRQGMREADIPAPVIAVNRQPGLLALSAELGLPADAVGPLAISAVIETKDGEKSYWALAHPSDKPDFHHPDSFVLELP